ncbi:transmembrane anterior posterior transformation protein 1 homolog [Morone saxatilis]|uniref:transmembrane anterior posterior transformation protein 1 homolog n=1 Tax=Morone saxatilis TaxID=34816 RepID=UPI0015E1D2D6|nr:transmembrane anterior posterior transformation protein 1 homolog [Morone saxatilis]
MADSQSSGLGEEKEKEKEDSERDTKAASAEKNKDRDGLTETLRINDKNGDSRGKKRNLSDLSLVRFITTELTRGYFLEHNEAKYTERRERVYTCLRIPKELEKLMTFGFFLCLDAFLYVFTLLPLRVILALLRLLTLPCCGLSGSRLLQPAQVCDVLKGFIMVLCYSMMSYVDYAMMYHLIRGQSVIKLYIIYNMLEVADRLFSSFGQDILDALYWTATEPKEKKRAHIGVIPHFLMAVLYVFLHAILIMVQATTLNVAFNSHNKSLLTIMMSNNFVEIKGSVFKKFEKNNLFQMSNSDIKERFTNYILLLIVCLRNMEQFSWNPDHLWVLFPDVVMVIASEVAVDVVKHAFITKFNDISADVYGEYRASLAFDLVSSRQKNAYTDYSDSVSRRMGFIPLPLALLLIRVVTSSVKIQGSLSFMCVLLFYLGMITLKVLNSIVLLGTSCVFVKEAKMEEKLFDPPPSVVSSRANSRAHRTKHVHPVPQQEVVEFFLFVFVSLLYAGRGERGEKCEPERGRFPRLLRWDFGTVYWTVASDDERGGVTQYAVDTDARLAEPHTADTKEESPSRVLGPDPRTVANVVAGDLCPPQYP